MSQPFTHLHCHSEFSLLDGAGRIGDLVKQAKALGMDSLALTDHGNLHGALKFYQTCNQEGIHPVLGYEAYIAPGSHKDKTGGQGKHSAFHLTLLAMNMDGFNNLIQMASSAFLDGFYYKPRIDKELLSTHSDGLICLSGCLGGELSQLLIAPTGPQMDKAREVIQWYRDLFGDRYYLEIQDNGIREQLIAMKHIIDLSKETGVPLVATSDVHYLKREDAKVQDILLCVATGKLQSDKNRFSMESDQFYLRSPEEMYEVFQGQEEAVARSHEIAQRCNVEWKLDQRYFPIFTPPDGLSSEEYLWNLCIDGLKQRYANNPKRYKDGKFSDEVMDRLKREHGVINKLGFPNYFLIVWDYVHFAHEANIECTARGSGVGALTSYALGISHVCPLEYDLLFERFLDENRVEAPDIDIDFEQARRAEVLQYVKDRYGEDHVAQIGTFGSMAAKAAINDVGRALGLPRNMVASCTSKISDALHASIKGSMKESPELQELYDKEPNVHEMIDLAIGAEGLTRQCGTHACAVVIGGSPITDYIPLMTVRGKTDLVTQWEGCDVEHAGLLKMDFLGLRNLSILSDSVRIIEQTRGIKIDPYSFPLDDQPTYDLLCRGETKGVFQLESPGMRNLLQRLKPDSFRDIIAVLALFRPGPLGGGMVDTYIEVKHKRQTAEYLHPILEEVLSETNGVMVYQEQIMRIFNRLGQIPLGESYKVIKAISKKKEAVIAKNMEKFIEGAMVNNLSRENAEKVWKLIVQFAGYGFNKSHTTAYALIAYMTAYLKHHYSVEFMAALLTGDLLNRQFNKKDPTAEHVEDCKRMGITVVPPDVNQMGGDYRVEDGKIYFSASGIKNCNEAAGRAIRQEVLTNGPFIDLFDFCERMDPKVVSRACIESLIKAGAFDSIGGNRAAMISVVERAISSAANKAKDRAIGQMNLFDLFGDEPQDEESADDDGSTPKQREIIPLPDVPEWEPKEKCAFEKEVLGFYLSSHPMDQYKDKIICMRTHSAPEALLLPDKGKCIVCGMVTGMRIGSVREPKPNKPSTYCLFELEDYEGTIHCNAWPETYSQCADLIKTDAIIMCMGKIERREGGETPNFTVTDVFSLESIDERYISDIEIKIGELEHGQNAMKEISKIISCFPGEKSVTVHLYTVDNIHVQIALGNRFRVNYCHELDDRLQRFLGPGCYKIIIRRPDLPEDRPKKQYYSKKPTPEE